METPRKRTPKIIKYFISCAPELGKEKTAIEEMLAVFRKRNVDRMGITLVSDAKKYDIFLGVAWTRFSPPQPAAGSATYDDFRRAYALHKQEKTRVKVMFFFKDYPVPPSKINADGLAALQRFIAGIRADKSVYAFYYDRDEFSRLVYRYVSRQVAQLNRDAASAVKPVRGVGHVLYRLAHNSDTLPAYLHRLCRLLSRYFEARHVEALILEPHGRGIRTIITYDAGKNKTREGKKSPAALSLEEASVLEGNVVRSSHVMAYPLLAKEHMGGLFVRRQKHQPPFKERDRQLFSFITEQASVNSMYFMRLAAS